VLVGTGEIRTERSIRMNTRFSIVGGPGKWDLMMATFEGKEIEIRELKLKRDDLGQIRKIKLSGVQHLSGVYQRKPFDNVITL